MKHETDRVTLEKHYALLAEAVAANRAIATRMQRLGDSEQAVYYYQRARYHLALMAATRRIIRRWARMRVEIMPKDWTSTQTDSALTPRYPYTQDGGDFYVSVPFQSELLHFTCPFPVADGNMQAAKAARVWFLDFMRELPIALVAEDGE